METEFETQILEWLQDIKDHASKVIPRVDNDLKNHLNNLKQKSEHIIELIYKNKK